MFDIEDAAVNVLAELGVYEAVSDQMFLRFIVSSVTERIKNETNQQHIPLGLYHAATEMVVGEYLTFKKNSGQLNIEGLDLEAAVKQIQEGDTNTVFAIGEGNMAPEQRLEVLISRLCRDRAREFIRYRRLMW